MTSASTLAAMRAALIPRATVLTPNLPEAEILLGRTVSRRGMSERFRKEIRWQKS